MSSIIDDDDSVYSMIFLKYIDENRPLFDKDINAKLQSTGIFEPNDNNVHVDTIIEEIFGSICLELGCVWCYFFSLCKKLYKVIDSDSLCGKLQMKINNMLIEWWPIHSLSINSTFQ